MNNVTEHDELCPCDTPQRSVRSFLRRVGSVVNGLFISSKMHSNARACIKETLAHFPQIRQIWTYANFPDHNNGRCCDYMITIPGMARADQVKLGDAIAQYYIDNAKRLGLNWLIWNRRIYRYQNTNRGHGWDAYHGPKPHTDHVHVEVTDQVYHPPTPIVIIGHWHVKGVKDKSSPTDQNYVNDGSFLWGWNGSPDHGGKAVQKFKPYQRVTGIRQYTDSRGRGWLVTDHNRHLRMAYLKKDN